MTSQSEPEKAPCSTTACSSGHSAQRFDPDKYRIILFDQRGAGKSKPMSELENNTTWDLVSDIEKVWQLSEHLHSL